MALIPLKEAATRLGVTPNIIEEWAKQGLVKIQEIAGPLKNPPDMMGIMLMERYVEEDQLVEVAESLGWLHLSAEEPGEELAEGPSEESGKGNAVAKYGRLPDPPFLDEGIPTPFDLPRPGKGERVKAHDSIQLPERLILDSDQD